MTKENEQYILEHNQISVYMPESDHKNVDFVGVSAYAAHVGVHNHTVLNWIKAGKIPFKPFFHGKCIRYSVPIDAVPPMLRPDRPE